MSESLLLQAYVDGVCTLTLNRPQSLNSFNQAMLGELLTCLQKIAEDRSVRCLILTGQGRAFCAGQDLHEPRLGLQKNQTRADLGSVIEQEYRPLILQLRAMPIPIIAAVNGVAAGAGANLAFACDIVIAGQSASFIQAFAKIGLVPDCGGTWFLPRLVGRAHALGLAWFGDKLTAHEAQQAGLIWQCVEDEQLTSTALALGQRLAAMPTRALVATRLAMDQAQQSNLAEALLGEAKWQRELGNANDYAEGVNAFIEKRSPHFSDR